MVMDAQVAERAQQGRRTVGRGRRTPKRVDCEVWSEEDAGQEGEGEKRWRERKRH